MFHDPKKFAFTARLEAAWLEVRAELDSLAVGARLRGASAGSPGVNN